MKLFSKRLITFDAVDLETNEVVCSGIRIAGGWFTAGVGLIGESGAQSKPLLINANALHTFGMRFELDVAFFDARGRCLKRINGLKPWRIALAPQGTALALETKASLPSVLQGIAPGSRIAFRLDQGS